MANIFIDVSIKNWHKDVSLDVPFLMQCGANRDSHRMAVHQLMAHSEVSKRGCLWFPLTSPCTYFSFLQKFPELHENSKLPATTRSFPLCSDVPASFFPWQHASMNFVRTAEATPEHVLTRLAVPPSGLPVNVMQDNNSMTIVTRREHGFVTVPLYSVRVQSLAPGGLLASDVGTGKTAVMLHTAVETARAGPTLIIVPTTLEGQWVGEAQRMFGDRVVTDPTKFQRDTINIWRCNTLVSYRKMVASTPEAPWTVVLTTYDFLAARVKELCGSVKRVADFSALFRAPAQFSAQHNLPTCFHDIHWNRIIFDEIQDGLSRCNHHFWSFVNALPTRHVWVMSATPTRFKDLVRVLRLKSVAVTSAGGKDVSRLLADLGVDLSFSVLQPRLFRVTKEDTTEKLRTGIQCTVVPLTLTDKEKQIMQYMRLMGGTANDALICTDVESFLQDLLLNYSTRCHTSGADKGEVVVCNIDTFWDRMRFENVAVGQELEKELNTLTQRIAELCDTMNALTVPEEVNTVRAEMRRHEAMLKTRKTNMARVAVKKEFLDNLNNRIEEAKVNPCPICVDDIGEGRMAITVCGHVFCIDCVTSWFKSNNSCPACRRMPLNMSDITVVDNSVPKLEVVDAQGKPPVAGPQSVYSTKIDFLLTHLRHVLSTTPDRVIVFCNYPATLRKLYSVLVDEGIDVACMTGNVHGKNKNMLKFKGRTVDSCRVMLLHTVTQNSGMDLIEANRIVFMDAHKLSPDTLRQAHGRCARLGQTKDIHLTFLTVPEFEEIPPLQEYVQGLNQPNKS